MTPLVIARLKDKVTGLQGRIHGAAALAALMGPDAVPQVTPCAHVMAAGIAAPGRQGATSGAFIQPIERQVAVALSLRVHDPQGSRALDEAEALIDAIVLALAGWAPDVTSVGVMTFRGAALVRFERGIAVYEIDFSATDQLRIGA